MQMQSERLQEYIDRMSRDLVRDYSIPAEMYENQDIKRGLRNNDGTGVLVGISKVGSVQGYYMVDGQRVPMPGKLYYRGISVEDIVDAHQQAGTFGYEEVAYLLLLGKLPTAEELAQFNQILAHARQMPAAFTEDMILKAPSRNIMNQLARSVLALYSFDDNADDASPENILRQSIELIARFPLIAANALMAKRHYFEGNSLYLHNPLPELSVAENLLRMTRADKSYSASARPDADSPCRALQQQLHLRLPCDLVVRHGYLQRHRRGRWLAERPAARRRECEGAPDVPHDPRHRRRYADG